MINGIDFITELNLIETSGFITAILGLSTNMNQPLLKTLKVADRLVNGKRLDGGKLNFLENIKISFSLKLPNYVWPEFDTYRMGITKQSQSQMHTIHKRALVESDFEEVESITLSFINLYRKFYHDDRSTKNLLKLRQEMTFSFLTTRVISANVKTLSHIYAQRKKHKLPHWDCFLNQICESTIFGDWIKKEKMNKKTMNILKNKLIKFEEENPNFLGLTPNKKEKI